MVPNRFQDFLPHCIACVGERDERANPLDKTQTDMQWHPSLGDDKRPLDDYEQLLGFPLSSTWGYLIWFNSEGLISCKRLTGHFSFYYGYLPLIND